MAMKKRAFAADFGAGNTCIYFIDPHAPVRACTALTDSAGEPSGYAIHENGNIVVGRGLYGLHYIDFDHIDEFHINLKCVPTEENRAELTKYFKLWLAKLRTEHPTEFQNVEEHWFIACPTGKEWKKKAVRELYKKIFEDAGFQNVTIVPESNGALAYFAYTRQILNNLKPSQKLLLIDLGAYSIDATPYFGDALGTSYGKYLGASLIDRMILRALLYFDEQKFRVGNKIINLPAVIDAAREKCEDEKFLTYMLLQARKLKEDFFTKERTNQLPPQNLPLTTDFYVEVGGVDEYLTLFVNPKMMNLLMEQMMVKEVLGEEFNTLPSEVQEYVGDLTWMDTLRKFFNELRAEYDLAADGSDAVIMLTGGGSLMKCISDEVKNQFPGATIHYDPQAISAIGEGITYWAPDKIKAIEYEDAYQNNFIERDGKNAIIPKFVDAFGESAGEMALSIIREERDAVGFGIGEWLEYHCDSFDIPLKLETHFKNWCENTGIPTFTDKLNAQINSLKGMLNAEYRQYVLDSSDRKPWSMLTGDPSKDTLLLSNDLVFLSDSRKLLRVIFELLTNRIVNYYKENDIWNHFTNEPNGWFSNPRLAFYNRNADDLSRWLNGQTKSTGELCQHLFFEFELPIGTDIKPTMLQHFVVEGWSDMEKLMLKRKKEILGRLVLEEALEDDD